MKRNTLLLAFVSMFSIMSLASCKEKENEYIRLAVYNTDEGISSYITGTSRTLLNNKSGGVDITIPEKKKVTVNGEEVSRYVDKDGNVINDLSGKSASYGTKYNEVKNYVLFSDDINETYESLNRERQGIDAAFIPVSELNNLSNGLDMDKLSIIFIDTYNNGKISGFWVATKDYLKNTPKYKVKFVSSLVRSNDFTSRHTGNLRTYAESKQKVIDDVAAKIEQNSTKFEKFIYSFLGKKSQIVSGKSADILDYTYNEVNDYLAVFDATNSYYEIKDTAYDYTRLTSVESYTKYEHFLDATPSGEGYEMCKDLYDTYLAGKYNNTFEKAFDLYDMINQQYLYSYCDII